VYKKENFNYRKYNSTIQHPMLTTPPFKTTLEQGISYCWDGQSWL